MTFSTIKNNIFFKYIFSYIIILFILIMGFYYIIALELKQQYQEVIYTQSQADIANLSNSIESNLDSIRNIDYSISSNMSITNSRYNSDNYSRIVAINELRKHIAGVYFISDILYHDVDKNSIISANGFIKQENGAFIIYMGGKSIELPMDRIFNSSDEDIILKVEDNQNDIFLFIPKQISLKYNSAYILNTMEFKSTLKTFLSQNIKSIYFLDNQNNIISSTTTEKTLSFLANIENSNSNIIHLDKDIDLIKSNIIANDSKIVALIDKNIMKKATDVAFEKAYLVLFLVILLGIIVVFFSMKITYKPISVLIKNIGGKNGNKNISLQNIVDIFDSTQIETNKLLEKITNYRITMQKSIIDSVVGENIGDHNNISPSLFEKVDSLFEPSSNNCLYVVKIHFEKNVIYDDISDYIVQLLPSNGVCMIIERNLEESTFLINYPGVEDHKDEVLHSAFLDIAVGINCKIAVSNSSTNPMHIAMLYDNVKLASLFWDTNLVVMYDNIKSSISKDDNITYPYKLLEKLNDDLTILNFTSAKNNIDELFEVINIKEYPSFFIRCVLIDTLTLIVSALNKSNIKFNEYKDIYLETLYLCRNDEYISKGQDIIENMKDIIDILSEEISASGVNIKIVKTFIENNCMSCDFSLVLVSEEFGVSVAYISYLFKKKLDMNISDFIWDLRVLKAKELLTKTNLSIEDISLQVGYYNASSFRRKFKETLGISPSAYRKNNNIQ